MTQQEETRPQTNAGTLVWVGEHWINAIRPDGADVPSAFFSLFSTRFSEAGEGNALQIWIPDADISMICTDHRPVGEWTANGFFKRSTVKTPDAPIVDAVFRREGDARSDPAWVVETETHRIVARWKTKEPPVIAYGPFAEDAEFFTLLFFTDESSVELDGERVEGKPYQRDIWRKTIGGDRSSSLFALAESLIRPVDK